jgi:hypothetical protein
MIKKILSVALLICAFAEFASAQQINDIAMLTNESTNSTAFEVNTATSETAEARYTLDSYGSTTKLKTAFEDEHFLGGETSLKWNLFQQNYKRVYEQTVGLSGSSVEIIKPTVFNAVNKVNNYYKKLLNSNSANKEEVAGILNHILDCANLLCYEEDTKRIEAEIKNAKNNPEIVQVFASIRIIQH